MPLNVVEAASPHVTLLASLHEEAFAGGEVWDAAAIDRLLELPGCFALVAADGTAMAMFRVAADEAELLTIAVATAARRRGAARALLREGAARAKARGARRLILEVSAENVPGRALYAALGFAGIGRRRRYYADGSDALVLARAL